MADHREFRWQHWDAALGDEWTSWHTVEGRCPACCCGAPDEGEHAEAEEYFDEDGLLANGHTRFDPSDEYDVNDRRVEWRTPSV